MVERSMIEGRTVLVTPVDEDLRPVADRRKATLLKIVFEDDGDTRYYATGRHKVPPWALLFRQVTPFRHRCQEADQEGDHPATPSNT
jgi:hypothetical protein